MKIVTLNFRYNWLSRNTDDLELDLQLLFFHSLLDYTVCGVKLHAHSVCCYKTGWNSWYF